MTRDAGPSSLFAILVGVFLLIEGVWGLFSPVVFGVLTTNTTHAVIHIILGAIGIYTGMRGGARSFCLFLGGLLVLVGVLFFVPGLGAIVTSLLNVQFTVAIFNIVVGAVALLVGFASRPTAVTAR